MSFSPEKIKFFRFLRSGLLEPFPDAETCAENLLGIQSQIFTAASLSIAMRTRLDTHADLLTRFSQDRTLIKTWGQRSTVHLFSVKNFPLFPAAFSEDSSWKLRQFRKAGGTDAQFDALMHAAATFLQEHESCPRAALDAFLQTKERGELLIGHWGGLMVDLGKRGQLCLGGYDQQAKAQLLYASGAWHPDLAAAQQLSADAANTALMLGYFRAYGPASVKDFCHWRGVPQRRALPWLEQIRPQLASILANGEELFLPTQDREVLEGLPTAVADLPSLLLYRFDPMVLAHKDKTWLVEERDYKQVWRKAAHVEGVVLKHGMAVGVWKFQRKGQQRLHFLVSWFRSRNKLGKRALKTHFQDISRYLGYAEWSYSEEKF